MSITLSELKTFVEKELNLANLDFNHSVKSVYYNEPTTMATTLKGKSPTYKVVVLRVKHEMVDDVALQSTKALSFDGYVGDEFIDEIKVEYALSCEFITKHPKWNEWVNACWVPPTPEEF
jgi:hypothetical protein